MVAPDLHVMADDESPPWLAARTRCCTPSGRAGSGWRWFVQQGAWSLRKTVLVPEGERPLALIGATIDEQRVESPEWHDWMRATGGASGEKVPVTTARSVCVNDSALALLGGEPPNSVPELLSRLLATGVRVLRHAPLDVCFDRRMRVLEVVTSLQRGGAERIALNLHTELPRHGAKSLLCVLGSPTRAAFDSPAGIISLKHLPFDSIARAEGIDDVAKRLGCDVIHGHLVEAESAAWLANHEWPVMVTLHNERAGWQKGFDASLAPSPRLMLLACSAAVERDARESMPGHLLRVTWNGITTTRRPSAMSDRQAWRPKLGLTEKNRVVLVLANPRPQKRLPLTAEVFVRWAEKEREAVLVLAGEPSRIHASAQAELDEFWRIIDSANLRRSVHELGAVEDVPGLLAACDVLLSTSAHEGMSMAQLEAIDAGLALVISDAGGAAELAAMHRQVHVISRGSPAAAFAEALDVAIRDPECSPLANDFTLEVMTRRHVWLLRCLLRNRELPRKGLLLVTNNFSTGGAQSSARRLLLALKERGMHVRAAVLQEEIQNPTPGRNALKKEGVRVIATPPPQQMDAMDALPCLLDACDHDPPAAVLFWNVMPHCKVLLAEAFDDVPVIDVSPGEMFFNSLERYFAKPRVGSPQRSARDYALLLSAVVVKHTEEERRARELFGDVPVRVIPNGVSMPAIARTHHEGIVFGTAARLHPQKRLFDLIEAFRIVHGERPDVRLLVAGGEEAGFEYHAQQLRASASDLPVDWLGDVQDMASFHSQLDAFVMISEPIGCPNASLEAMASGLCVVATAVGGANDQIVHEQCGLLVLPRDAGALASQMLRVINDPSLRARLGEAARARIEAKFSLQKMAGDYAELIEAAMTHHLTRSPRQECRRGP